MRARAHHLPYREGVFLNLRRKYPISTRWVFKRCLTSFVALLLVGALCLVGLPKLEQLLGAGLSIGSLPALLFLGFFAAFAAKVGYEMLSRRYYHYGIEGGNFVIAKGIILRQRGCFPLSQITDIYLNRTFMDFLFGLYNLDVSTPTTHSGEFARVDGLPKNIAVAMQDELLHILHDHERQTAPEQIIVENPFDQMLPPTPPRNINLLEH